MQVLTQITPDSIDGTLQVLARLSDDGVFYQRLFDNLRLHRTWELRVAVHSLAQQLQPSTYLEIGVRRGWCAAQVAAVSPDTDLYLCDQWIWNYGGCHNPGPRFVEDEIRKCGTPRSLQFLNGDSHAVLPDAFASGLLPDTIDMIVIDGDHTPDGARQDLQEAGKHLAAGGVLLFDDLHERNAGLREVWREFVEQQAGCWHENQFACYAVGVFHKG